MTKRKLLAYSAFVAAIAGAIVVGGSASANADTMWPSMDAAATIAPGGVGDVGATVGNQFGEPKTGGVALYLQAPPNSTFTSATVWGTKIVQGVRQGGSTPYFTNCVLSAGNTRMRCEGTLTIPAAGNGKVSAVDLTTQIRVNATAGADQTYTSAAGTPWGGFNLTNSSDNVISGGVVDLAYKTPAVVDTPVVAPSIAAGTTALTALIGATALLRRRRRIS